MWEARFWCEDGRQCCRSSRSCATTNICALYKELIARERGRTVTANLLKRLTCHFSLSPANALSFEPRITIANR